VLGSKQEYAHCQCDLIKHRLLNSLAAMGHRDPKVDAIAKENVLMQKGRGNSAAWMKPTRWFVQALH